MFQTTPPEEVLESKALRPWAIARCLFCACLSTATIYKPYKTNHKFNYHTYQPIPVLLYR